MVEQLVAQRVEICDINNNTVQPDKDMHIGLSVSTKVNRTNAKKMEIIVKQTQQLNEFSEIIDLNKFTNIY